MHYRGFDGDEELIRSIDAVNARACSTQRELFRLIAEGDRCEVWRNHGAANMAHWVCMRYGISYWKAERWIAASHVLERLPRISEAFACGDLSIDKVVELTRFATPQTEGRLISWAQEVSSGCIRRKGDVAARSSIEKLRKSTGIAPCRGGTSTTASASAWRRNSPRPRVRCLLEHWTVSPSACPKCLVKIMTGP